MSTRSRSAAPALAALGAGLLLLAPSVAAADPPAGDARQLTCGALLQQVTEWPGEGTGGVQTVSDAYERHLLTQPECASTGT
jgi:hypothetical protein